MKACDNQPGKGCRSEIYEYLKQLGIWFEVTEHQAVFNMEEPACVQLPYPEADAKNILVRDDKKRNYYLITVKGNKRVNLKEFRNQNGTRPLSFASEEELMSLMGLIPGAVTPFGILNDKECRVQCFIDREFAESSGIIGVHPNDNTATVWLKTEALAKIIREHGNAVQLVQL